MSIKIIKGEDFTIKVQLKDSNGECYDLTGLTAASAIFKDTGDLDVSVTFAAGDIALDGAAGGGKLDITLDETFSASLKAGKTQSFELEIDKGAEKRIIQFSKELEIVERY